MANPNRLKSLLRRAGPSSRIPQIRRRKPTEYNRIPNPRPPPERHAATRKVNPLRKLPRNQRNARRLLANPRHPRRRPMQQVDRHGRTIKPQQNSIPNNPIRLQKNKPTKRPPTKTKPRLITVTRPPNGATTVRECVNNASPQRTTISL